MSIFTGGIIQLVMFIIMLLSLSDIRDANLELGNEQLEKFRKYIIYAVIVGIVGAVIIIVTAAVVAFLFISALSGFTFSDPITISEFQEIVPLSNILMVMLLAGGIPVGAVSLALMMIGWNELHPFLERNSGLFPKSYCSKSYRTIWKNTKVVSISPYFNCNRSHYSPDCDFYVSSNRTIGYSFH